MRRVIVATVLCLLAMSTGARAQKSGVSASATPAVGGGSFVAAPLLKQGSYRDTILAGENLFYAIDVKAGQAIRVQAELEKEPPENSGLSIFAPVIYSPLREIKVTDIEIADAATDTLSPGTGGRIDVTTTQVTSLAEADKAGVIYEGPGTWYVGFSGVFGGSGEPPRIETPFTFSLELVGEPIAEPKVEFEEPQRPEPKPKAAAAPAPATDDDGGSTGLVVGIAAAGLLLGAGAGTVARRRRSGPG